MDTVGFEHGCFIGPNKYLLRTAVVGVRTVIDVRSEIHVGADKLSTANDWRIPPSHSHCQTCCVSCIPGITLA